jgi:Flp pilus assembly protein TadG
MKSRDEAGNAIVEFIWLGILLLVPLVYILLAVFDVQRGAFGVSAAARAAGRAYTLADSVSEAEQRAREAARVALADQGIEGPFSLQIDCAPSPCLSPGSITTVSVSTQVVLPLVPMALGGGKPSFRVESVHRVPLGTYVEAHP